MREDLFLAYERFQRGISRNGYKLIEYRVNGSARTQLFDLRNDPWETVDLSHDSAHASTLDELRSVLAVRARDWDDTSTPWGKAFWKSS